HRAAGRPRGARGHRERVHRLRPGRARRRPVSSRSRPRRRHPASWPDGSTIRRPTDIPRRRTMETRTLIKDSATVARVTQLEEGDAYRRLIPKTTYQGARMVVGVVTSVLNNGETVAITALEVKEDSNRYTADSPVEVKIFEADADLALFPRSEE